MLILIWLAIAVIAIFGLLSYFRHAIADSPAQLIETAARQAPSELPAKDGVGSASTVDTAPQVSRRKSAPKRPEDPSAFAPLLPREFIVLDFETTGLDSARHEIIEIGAIHANLDSSTHASFQTLVKCAGKVSKKITGINGITQAMLDQDGIELSDALTQLAGFVRDLPIVTYNAEFDMRFLRAAAAQVGLDFTNHYTCALQLARRAWPDLDSHKLSDLAVRGNLSIENAHRALGDCERALIIFVSAANQHGKRIIWKELSSNRTEIAIN